MKIALGKQVYDVSAAPTRAVGVSFSANDLELALKNRLPSLLSDQTGRQQIRETLQGIANTQFESQRLQAALMQSVEPPDWQVGEAIAEAYLTDHKACDFPWPSSRDLRNPSASPTGADLVGFQNHNGSARLAFGEVKTSTERKWPPQVVTGRHGLINQLEELRDSTRVKNHLGIIYLGYRAQGASWQPMWKNASQRYLTNSADISLFGVLLRDVEPKEDDLKERAQRLARGCPVESGIELVAFYLPEGQIKDLGKRAIKTGGAVP